MIYLKQIKEKIIIKINRGVKQKRKFQKKNTKVLLKEEKKFL